LDLSECGLGDSEIETLTAAASAPRLRSVRLAYNSVGSRGARALAAWEVLPQLWELNLHDNIIGDDGLIALATSRRAERLLELDLEQDCWNGSARPYRPAVPAEVIDPTAFPSLDLITLGLVDEYHCARYSCGFPSEVRHEIVSASATPAAVVAFLTHLDMNEIDDSDEPVDSDDSGADSDSVATLLPHIGAVEVGEIDSLDESDNPDNPKWVEFMARFDAGEFDNLDNPLSSLDADHDFRVRRAEHHAELVNEAMDFARQMIADAKP
jgi:hypothetical protein